MSIENKRAAGVRGSVLDFMGARAEVGKPAASLPAEPQAAIFRNQRFSDLPAYRQVQTQIEVIRQLDLENPFYRAHDAAAGVTTSIDGRRVDNFGSYDYLGLNTHPEVISATSQALHRYGVSASASRLVAGERPIHASLEAGIAANYGVHSAIVFVSGYLTNATVIGALVGPGDLILYDELVHNSILTGAKLSGAARRSFRHNDLADLGRLLDEAGGRHRHFLVIAEGLYSMDGDLADLPGLLELRRRHGFWLMMDEAHALGVIGRTGKGSAEHFGCDPTEVDLWMGTLSKAMASCGGYVAGNAELTVLLKAAAGGFVYSVGMPPALAAAAQASLGIMEREPERVARLQANGRYFLERARAAGLHTGDSEGFSVVPVMVRDSVRAVCLSAELLEHGVNALPIIYPAVPEGLARIRFFLTSEHTEAQIDRAVALTAEKLGALETRGFGIASLDISKLTSF